MKIVAIVGAIVDLLLKLVPVFRGRKPSKSYGGSESSVDIPAAKATPIKRKQSGFIELHFALWSLLFFVTMAYLWVPGGYFIDLLGRPMACLLGR
jgi:hypothetical protein